MRRRARDRAGRRLSCIKSGEVKGTDAIVPEPGDVQSVRWDLRGGDAGCDVRLCTAVTESDSGKYGGLFGRRPMSWD